MNVKTYKAVIELLMRAGISEDDAMRLRRISMTLKRWYEGECNGVIQRNEDTGVPLWVTYDNHYKRYLRYPTPTGPVVLVVPKGIVGCTVRLEPTC